MQVNFKAGDKVIVVEPCAALLMGSVHVVHDIREILDDTYVYFYEDGKSLSGGWLARRFIKYEEKEKELKIEMNKKYRVISTHKPVRIICTDRKYSFAPYIGLFTNEDGYEAVLFFDNSGCLRGQKIIEEVPAVDWDKVKADTPIWIRTSNNFPWHKRHFHKFEEGRVYYWPNGTTSFTCEENHVSNCVPSGSCTLEEPK